jgi:replicative DNA helicase
MQGDPLQGIEQCFLGCLFASDRAYDEHTPKIRQEYFSIPVHARIFEAIRVRYEEGKPVSVALIAPLFADDPDLSGVGGAKYIFDLADCVITTMQATINGYAEKIHDEHCRRAVLRLSGEIGEFTKKPDFSAKTELSSIETVVSNLVAGLTAEGDDPAAAPDLSSSVDKALDDIRSAQAGSFGIRTGLGKLDAHLRGLKPGRLHIVAGRPAMGKTAFGVTVAVNAALAGKKVLLFSIEMGESDLTQRILARLSGISVDAMNTPHLLTEEEDAKIGEAAEKIRHLPLSVKHRQFLTASNVLSMARRFKRKHGLDLLMIDYLGLMQAEDKKAIKVHQIEEITTGLKRAANTLEVPVVLLAQLNRGVELRDDKRPQLSDLRDSGSIEQDADVVMLLYREEYYLTHKKPISEKFGSDHRKKKEAERGADIAAIRGRTEIIIAKNRQGRTGTIHAIFDGERQVFHE